MTKILLKIMIFIFVIFIICSFCVGNYLYDYTLNVTSDKNISEMLNINHNANYKNQKWLDMNSHNIFIDSHDHLSMHGYYIDNQSDVYIIMVHGYRSEGSSVVAPAKKMDQKGYNILIPDLRGHGRSEGDFIGMGWIDRLDILDWIDKIIGYDRCAKIILYGISMGGATVMNVAGENPPHQVRAVIEDCGYTSVWDVFMYHLKEDNQWMKSMLYMSEIVSYMRAGYFIKDASPINQIKKSNIPILFIHGDQDDFVPFYMLDELYYHANNPKEKLIIKGGKHANSYVINPGLYYSTVFAFIDKYI